MEKKILVVDDSMFMRVQLRNILCQAGYAVSEAANGKEAVDMWPDLSPDLTVMDITMPVMDGLTAIKEILSATPGARIIVCSALGQSSMVLQSVQCGARDFIVKPFKPQRVLDSVLQQIGK